MPLRLISRVNSTSLASDARRGSELGGGPCRTGRLGLVRDGDTPPGPATIWIASTRSRLRRHIPLRRTGRCGRQFGSVPGSRCRASRAPRRWRCSETRRFDSRCPCSQAPTTAPSIVPSVTSRTRHHRARTGTTSWAPLPAGPSFAPCMPATNHPPSGRPLERLVNYCVSSFSF